MQGVVGRRFHCHPGVYICLHVQILCRKLNHNRKLVKECKWKHITYFHLKRKKKSAQQLFVLVLTKMYILNLTYIE